MEEQTLKYNPVSWRVPYNPVVSKDPKQVLVTYALQFLLVVLVYPIPETGPSKTQKNYYRHLWVAQPSIFCLLADFL